MDERIKKLAHNLVNYSTKVGKKDKVLISASGDDPKDLVKALVKEVYAAGGYPYVQLADQSISREIMMGCSEEQLKFQNEFELFKMKGMDCYIGIGSSDNSSELSDVPSETMGIYNKMMRPVLRERVDNSRWVILRYPNGSMAQSAKMSKEAFEDYFFNVCNLDYSKMAKAFEPLKELMEKTDKVHIKAPGTDLTFSIKGIPAIPCVGNMNIPDGEIYTAPVKDSINGTLSYNTKTDYMGFIYEDVKLTFKDGKIIEATANDTERINEVFDLDEGARYVGEFALGVNPYINTPMLDTLFDEKIAGSFHFTPGSCYEDADNGNHSTIHWDMIQIQTPEYGGGEIYFDDVLIRKDGLFVLPELEPLNPENLK